MKRGLGRWALVLAAVWLLGGQALAEEILPEELRRAAPEAAELAEEGDLAAGLSSLWERAWGEASAYLLAGARSVAAIAAGVVLLGAAESAFSGGAAPRFTTMVGALWVTAVSAGDLGTLIGLGRETVSRVSLMAKVLLPVMAGATAASGGVAVASVGQVAAVFFSDLLLSVIQGVLLPAVYLYIGVSAAGAVLEGETMAGLGRLLKKAVTWSLTGMLTLFTGYLTISGAVAGAADARAVKLAKAAVSGAVPVVGGILADAAETVLAGAGLLRATVGSFGTLAVLGLCLAPFLRLGSQYLLYQGAALVAQTAGPKKLTALLSALGDAFGLVLAMTAASAVLLLIALVSSLTAVTV